MEKAKQASESIKLAIILALSGGFMDAYSYIFRGHVFANAQTGNMLLLGVNLAEGNFDLALRYFFPICSFAIGITISDYIHLDESRKLHWRQKAVFIEAIILGIVAFIPTEYNLIANSLTSLACGIQVEAFRKVHGNAAATTMCIGNLRSGTENWNLFIQTRNVKYLKKSTLYYSLIICFVIGAILGNDVIKRCGQYALLGCSFLLTLAYLFMFDDRENSKKILEN